MQEAIDVVLVWSMQLDTHTHTHTHIVLPRLALHTTKAAPNPCQED